MDNEHKLDTDISQAFPWGVSVVTFDEEDDPDDYERSWTVVIPRVLADIYDIAYLTVPIRSVLKLVADANPRDAHRILALRDAYYGGDSESDYECYATENINRTMTHEERAMVKAARAKGFEEREAARVAFEAEMALPEPEPEPLTYEDWHPFSEERAQLAAEFEALRLREDAYAAEWDRYAVDCNRIYHEDISRWANWRADLMDEKDAIELAHHEYAKRYESLVDNVSAEACKKQENNR